MTDDNPFNDDDWLVPLRDWDQIDGNLWMGAAPAGNAPPQFDHFVCLTNTSPKYGRLPYQTVTYARMVDCEFIPNAQLLERTVAITRFLMTMGPTLVHCQAGLNRSGLIVALVLMSQGRSAVEAINHIRMRRDKTCLCNSWFEQYLLNQDKK